ncbi:MAG: hypothetical protein ACP5F8_03305 [Candidatus Aenigmatarchaeota archaeon]|jgi:hypothetical protein
MKINLELKGKGLSAIGIAKILPITSMLRIIKNIGNGENRCHYV